MAHDITEHVPPIGNNLVQMGMLLKRMLPVNTPSMVGLLRLCAVRVDILLMWGKLLPEHAPSVATRRPD